MISRQNRLKTIDFKKLERGSNIITPLFKCKIISNLNNENKLAVVITKKILKRSIDRHKLKRKICYAYKSLELDKTNKTLIIQAISKDEKINNYKNVEESLKDLKKEINN